MVVRLVSSYQVISWNALSRKTSGYYLHKELVDEMSFKVSFAFAVIVFFIRCSWFIMFSHFFAVDSMMKLSCVETCLILSSKYDVQWI